VRGSSRRRRGQRVRGAACSCKSAPLTLLSPRLCSRCVQASCCHASLALLRRVALPSSQYRPVCRSRARGIHTCAGFGASCSHGLITTKMLSRCSSSSFFKMYEHEGSWMQREVSDKIADQQVASSSRRVDAAMLASCVEAFSDPTSLDA
jgi:hypothetical protein